MRRLTIGDRHLRVRDEGEGEKSPLVLIHGAGGSSVTWMEVVRRLAPRRRVIAPDLPGHGQSDPWPGDPATLSLYADFVGTVCAALGVQRAVLGGHSMGGAIALRCALAWPERVAGLVLVATGARLKVNPAIYAKLEHDFDDYPAWAREWSWSPATPRDVVDRWTAVSVQAPAEVCAADFRSIDGFDDRPRLGEVKAPTLVVGGADDRLTPPRLQHELCAGIAGARAVILPHAGHYLMHEQPAAFHAALEPFLAEVG